MAASGAEGVVVFGWTIDLEAVSVVAGRLPILRLIPVRLRSPDTRCWPCRLLPRLHRFQLDPEGLIGHGDLHHRSHAVLDELQASMGAAHELGASRRQREQSAFDGLPGVGVGTHIFWLNARILVTGDRGMLA